MPIEAHERTSARGEVIRTLDERRLREDLREPGRKNIRFLEPGDLRWRAKEYLTLFVGFGLLDSEIDRYAGRPYTAGNEVPYAPEYTANVGADRSIPLGNSGTSLVARLDGSATGETWFSAVQEESVQAQFGVPGGYSKAGRDAFSLLNARLGISADRWAVTAWARNVTDEEYLAEVMPAPEFGGADLRDQFTRHSRPAQ